MRKVEIDEIHGGIVKINPLADWTWAEVWSYIRARDIPYNALHDLRYPSMGCTPCRPAVAPGEDRRRALVIEAPHREEYRLHPSQSAGRPVPGAYSGWAVHAA